jgi:hypothetical protein
MVWSSVAQAPVRDSFAPAAEPWPLGAQHQVLWRQDSRTCLPAFLLVTTTHYHLWTDALHARALATQARNTWDRGAYVRWAVNTAWTVFETVCEDALGATGLGNRFKEKLDEAISALSLPPLDWGKGLWQKVLNVYRLRKEYVHVALPQNRLFADVAEANDAISILREAVKAIYQHAGKTPPNWVDDDRDRGWDDGGGSFGVLTIRRQNTDETHPDVVKIAHLYRGHEYVSEILPPGTDPEPYIASLLRNTTVPISAVRIYRGHTLVEDRPIPMRGT